MQQVDPLIKKLGSDPVKVEAFLGEYTKRSGPEPASKDAALTQFFTKHFKGDKAQVAQSMDLMKQVPGHEPEVFAQLLAENPQSPALAKPAGAVAAASATTAAAPTTTTTTTAVGKAPAAGAPTTGGPAVSTGAKLLPVAVGGKAPPPGGPASPASKTLPSAPNTTAAAVKSLSTPSSPTRDRGPPSPSRRLGSPPLSASADVPSDSSSSSAAAANATSFPIAARQLSTTTTAAAGTKSSYSPPASPPRPKSTCSRPVRDRIVAMLATYDPDSLLQFDEDCDVPDTVVGTAFLSSLIEQHGPEPPSKRGAIENLLRRLFEKQDPPRIRSVKTLVGAAEASAASGKDLQIVRVMFQAYGLGHRVGHSVASLGLAPPSISTSFVSMAAGTSAGGGKGGAASSASTAIDFSSASSIATNSMNERFTTSAIMAPFSPSALSGLGGVAAGQAWSPERSMNTQRGLFSSSPRHLPLTSQKDLLSQLSGAPQVRAAAPTDPPPSFRDLLIHDTFVGEQDVSSAGGIGGIAATSDALEWAMRGHNPFLKASRGEDVSRVDYSEPDFVVETAAENPFLKPGQAPAFDQGGIRRAAVLQPPKAPELALPRGFDEFL